MEVDRTAAGAVCALVDEDAVHRGGGLEAGGGVQHVAPGHALALTDPRLERDDGFAGGDADADAQLARRILFVQRVDRADDREAGADGTLGVVLVGDRGAKERDDGVADELLDAAAVLLEHVPQPGVVRLEQREDVLGVELLGAARRADDVDEHGRDRAALFVPPWRLGRRRVRGERRRAGHAELRDVGIVRPALCANRHG